MKEIIEKYPLSVEALKKWIENSLRNSEPIESIPTDFVEAYIEQAKTDESLIRTLQNNPRWFFDFFDENELYIHIFPTVGVVENKIKLIFTTSIQKNLNDHNRYLKKFISRKEAELNSIEMAFEILEEDLKPIEFEKL